MKRNFSYLQEFMEERVLDAHPDYHYADANNAAVARMGVDHLAELGLKPADKIIDIGCGRGRDVRYMLSKGYNAWGLNFLQSEIDNELQIIHADQNFTNILGDTFDCVWSRHSLEHSLMPFYTLFEYNRILVDGGLCYVELPAPNQEASHETNPNHYAVMDARMWEHLFLRSGFKIEEHKEIDFFIEGTTDGKRIVSNLVEGKELFPGDMIDKWLVYYLRKISRPEAGYFRNEKERGVSISKEDWEKLTAA